jgi:signal transduction histidine kinase
MRTWSDAALRRWGVLLFVLLVLLDVSYIVLARGVDHQPALNDLARLDLGEVAGIITPGIVGLVLIWARPRNAVGWMVALPAVFLGLCDTGQEYAARAAVFPDEHLPLSHWVGALSAPLWIPALLTPATLLLVRYPSGTIQDTWPRRFNRMVILGMALLWCGYASSDNAVSDIVKGGTAVVEIPTAVQAAVAVPGIVLLLTGALGIVADAFRRAFRSARPDRLSLLWLLTWAVLAVLVVMFTPFAWIGSVAYSGVMVAVAIGVLRYGTLGIEVVVRRTLVYALLTGAVLTVFVGVVAGLAAVVPKGPAPQIVAAVLIAVGLAPARDRLQSLIDRLLYGERRDPFAALQRLSTPMGDADQDMVSGVLAALRDALRVEEASIEQADGPGIPLVFGGEQLGRLHVSPRKGETSLGKADERLIEAVAPLVAAVLHAVRLAEDVRVQQDRVLTATQTERARLRQELHDGLGPSLTGVGLGLEAAERNTTPALLARLRIEVASALEEVRRIIEDLRPQALDEDDLLSALRRRVEQVTATGGVEVGLEAPSSLPALAIPVSTAVYRIADEALTNVVRHAHASRCTVAISVDGELHLEVRDNGVGPGRGRDGGFGLGSMRQRAEHLGGTFTVTELNPGTSVRACLPLVVAS